LILGNDPRNMSKACLDIVANKEIIALNQVRARARQPGVMLTCARQPGVMIQ
jgi:hypothetical protein